MRYTVKGCNPIGAYDMDSESVLEYCASFDVV
jgi:hypothetical protein